MNNKRGQVIIFDLIVAIAIFTITFLLFYNQFFFSSNDEAYDYNRASEKINQLGYFLISTSGVPNDWDETDVEAIGIASEKNVIDETKLSMLVAMGIANSSNMKQKLDIQAYNFSFSATHPDGALVQLNNSIYQGNASFGTVQESKNKIKSTRIASYKNSEIILKLEISK